MAQFREHIENGGKSMTEKLDDKELVSFKELLMSNSIQVDEVSQLLIEKGLITEDEFYNKLKEVMYEYQEKQKGKIE